MRRRCSFRKPPAQGGADHSGMNDVGDVGDLRDCPILGCDHDPVTVADPIGSCSFGVNFDERMRPFLPQSCYPPVGREEIAVMRESSSNESGPLKSREYASASALTGFSLSFSPVLSFNSTFPVGVRNPFVS